jgi:hypothetical protein
MDVNFIRFFLNSKYILFLFIIIIIIIIILLQMGFSPVAVVQQVHNRQFNTHYTK